ncbi:Methyltransferase-like protein [Artemisia annua]|uniref:Methyltransferase-like protein n=1 Tax=Artemisia annua TaxID=35608 RepID=A0A2U1NWZ5_ARTAN|nr:Methyltransferase-like protein [Artemisia annua]
MEYGLIKLRLMKTEKQRNNERRYLFKEFPELASFEESSKLLEVGCGNRSTVLPILRCKENILVYACDCSTEALERTTEVIYASNVVSPKSLFRPFCWDFSTSRPPTWLLCDSCYETPSQKPNILHSEHDNNERHFTDINLSKERECCIGGMNFVTLIFTLSAVPLDRMSTAVAECFSVLKPGLYDMTMLRFEAHQRVGFREYKRADGTRTRDLFLGAGFIQVELEYCCVKSVSRRKQKTMHRVWVHGKFQKPM